MEVVEKLKSKKSRGKKWIKRFLYLLLFFFIFINFVAFMHARKFTNFSTTATHNPSSTDERSTGETMKSLLLGIEVPRPENNTRPNVAFEEVILNNENGRINAWWMPLDSAEKTVIISHGFRSCMSKMLPYANAIREMGHNVLMFDSTGSGDSEGNHCTIGHKESKDLTTVFEYATKSYGGDIYVLGTSMGAALTLRSIAVDGIQPKGVIIQCPFATMKDAVKGRFRNMGVPYWGAGHLLMFWGGTQNGFNAYKHNPYEYAQKNEFPTLLIWGEKDDRVTREETDLIFENLAGEKELVVLENAGHSLLVQTEPTKWKSSVRSFLNQY